MLLLLLLLACHSSWCEATAPREKWKIYWPLSTLSNWRSSISADNLCFAINAVRRCLNGFSREERKKVVKDFNHSRRESNALDVVIKIDRRVRRARVYATEKLHNLLKVVEMRRSVIMMSSRSQLNWNVLPSLCPIRRKPVEGYRYRKREKIPFNVHLMRSKSSAAHDDDNRANAKWRRKIHTARSCCCVAHSNRV